MRTFKQFIGECYDILERYYEPDEKLPSGKTPIQKSSESLSKAFKNRNKTSERNRTKNLADKIRTHVKHGADNSTVNPNISKKDRGKIETNVDDDGFTDIHDKESGVTYHAKNHGKAGYELHWSHNKDNSKLTPQQKVKLGLSARGVFHKHVLPRLRNNKPVSTIAADDENTKKKDKKRTNPQNSPNKRAEIYNRSGFSPRDTQGIINGKVRKAKKNSITPISPVKSHERRNSELVKQIVKNPRNLAADYDDDDGNDNKKHRNKDSQLSIPTPFRFNPRRSKNKETKKRPEKYSGNIAKNNPTSLRDLENERSYKDFSSEFN